MVRESIKIAFREAHKVLSRPITPEGYGIVRCNQASCEEDLPYL